MLVTSIPQTGPTLTVTKSYCIIHFLLFPLNVLNISQLKSFQPLYTSAENKPSVNLSDRSGVGAGLVRQPISLVPN